jgi:hypothetical protein
MQQSPFWEANRFAASQEIPRILWNPKLHYSTHKRPPPVSIMSQLNPVHTPTSHLSGLFPSAFPIKTLPLPHPCYMPRPTHSSRFYHPHNSGWGVQVMELLIMTFLHSSVISSLFGPSHERKV